MKYCMITSCCPLFVFCFVEIGITMFHFFSLLFLSLFLILVCLTEGPCDALTMSPSVLPRCRRLVQLHVVQRTTALHPIHFVLFAWFPSSLCSFYEVQSPITTSIFQIPHSKVQCYLVKLMICHFLGWFGTKSWCDCLSFFLVLGWHWWWSEFPMFWMSVQDTYSKQVSNALPICLKSISNGKRFGKFWVCWCSTYFSYPPIHCLAWWVSNLPF